MPDKDECFTRQEVAARLKVGVRTVGRMLEAGLPYIKFGDAPNSAVRIRRTDLEAWLEKHSVERSA